MGYRPRLHGEAPGEALEVDRAPAVRPLADLPDAVMGFHREQHGAAGNFDDAGRRNDGAPDGRRREMAHIDFAADGRPAGGAAAAADAISIARIIIGVPKTKGMPSIWAPTVRSRVTTTSCRPVMPARTFSSGSVI
jgi:hypothetical protein